MKYSRIFHILSLAIVFSLLMIAIPATPALAAKVITVTPDSGRIGDRITIEGSGFAQSTDIEYYVNIYLSSVVADTTDDIADEVDTYELMRQGIYIEEEGTFSTYFVVPAALNDGSDDRNVRTGNYYVYVTYYSTSDIHRISAVAAFTVIGGEIAISPNNGLVGTEVMISGSDFGGSENITVKYDGNALTIQAGDSRTDSSGNFANTKIVVPESAAGNHTITVISQSSGSEVEATFTVKPSMTISPTSGDPNTQVTVTGIGFIGNRSVTIYFGDTEVETVTTDVTGSFSGNFPVPGGGSGTYQVKADDGTNTVVASDSFRVAARASIGQTTGYVGDQITVTGTGFNANSPVIVIFNPGSVQAGTVIADAGGNLVGSVTVPPLAGGSYVVKITDGSNSLEANFAILVSVSLDPTTGNIGTKLTVSGQGFVGVVKLKYDDTEEVTATVSGGTFSATFNAPPSKAGPHTITVSDNITSKQLTFTMESTSPSQPQPLLPLMGAKAVALAPFDWQDVTDPSGVTYTLQIATNQSFSEDSIVLEKKGLTKSEYTLTEEEKLESKGKEDLYYWRVRAIDGASNEGTWTGAGTFYIGFQISEIKGTNLEGWLLYTVMGVGGLILFFLGLWVGRRTAYY